jgi:diguanylate cyclase (GGDEF)-like protein
MRLAGRGARGAAPRRLFALRVALPIAAIVGAALGLLFASTAWTAREQNRYALDSSRRLAAGVMRAARDAAERGLIDYAVWDDAARNLALAFDESWATYNAGWLGQTFGADLAFVVDAEDRTVHGLVDGERVGTAAGDALAGGVDELVRAARAAPGTAVTGFLAAPGGVPALAVAAAVVPHSAALPRPAGPGTVWLAADRLDEARLREIGEIYVLRDLRFASPAEAPAGASLPLAAPDGRPLGVLAWRPERPGDDLLRRLAPPLGALALALAAAAALVLAQARRAALLIRASEERAVTDPLTGLANRALLARRAEEGLARLREGRDGGEAGLALLYLDLDGFKAVNDAHGHGTGDDLLRLAAARLRGCLREGDTLARVGGDEFVILLPGLAAPAAAAAVACAERALAALADPFRIGGVELAVGVSVGIATATAATTGADSLLRAADRALYLAKRGGRGTWRLAEGLERQDDAPHRRPPEPAPAGALPGPGLPTPSAG